MGGDDESLRQNDIFVREKLFREVQFEFKVIGSQSHQGRLSSAVQPDSAIRRRSWNHWAEVEEICNLDERQNVWF